MKLVYLKSPEILDDFVKSSSKQFLSFGSEFLQSWSWGEILRQENGEIIRLGVQADEKMFESKNILAVVTLVKKKIFGPYFYWYAPRGPIFKNVDNEIEKKEVVEFLIKEIKKINKKALFLRIEPLGYSFLNKLDLKKTQNLEPAMTLILDLTKSEEELMLEMHQKTRYNLRLALKKGIKIIEGNLDDFPEFWRLLTLTGERDVFRLHEARHYLNMLEFSGGAIKIYFAEYNKEKIATGLFSFWGDKVTYLHGASDNQYRNVMAPYLLQWELIRAGKNKAFTYYDFYGIDENKWPGVTRFKLGFGGRVIVYPGTFDYIFKVKIYAIYSTLRRLNRTIRSYLK